MSTGIFNIGLSGMNAARLGLQVVQHNISNAGTDGYSRQSIVQTASLAQGTGSGYFGTGTQVVTVKRQYDQFLSDQVNRIQSQISAMKSVSGQMSAVDEMLADPSAGVSPALADFFKATQQVAAYPSSLAARQSMVSAAQLLTSRMNSMANQITELSGQNNIQLKNDAGNLNSLAQQLVELNRQINTAGAFNQAPNDLLDKRDLVIAEMSKLADITTVTVTTDTGGQSTTGFGNVQVYLGSGYQLVGDNGANTVEAKPSSSDPTRLNLYVGGNEVQEGAITGGSLGGALNFRSGVLDSAENALGQVAYSLASAFNAQHSTGMDMLGNNAGDTNFVADFFNIPTSVTATPSAPGEPALAVNLDAAVLSGQGPNGYYQSFLTKDSYELRSNDGSGDFTLTRLSDGVAWTGDIATINSSLQTAQQGFQLGAFNPASSVPAAGVTYSVRPALDAARQISVNSKISADPRLIAAGLPVTASTPVANQGSLTATMNRLVEGYSTTLTPLTITSTFNSGTNEYELSFSSASAYPVTMITQQNGQDVVSGPYNAGDVINYVSGARYNVGGMVFTLAGTPSQTHNDTVELKVNDGSDGNPIGASDSTNLVMMGALQSQKILAGANTVGGAYAQMVADVGNQSSANATGLDSQQTLLDMAIASRDSASGVNLDEEAANLLYFQQLYQANAKSLQAGQKIFDTLMSIFG